MQQMIMLTQKDMQPLLVVALPMPKDYLLRLMAGVGMLRAIIRQRALTLMQRGIIRLLVAIAQVQ